MPHFGTRSRERRDTCHPDAILVLDEGIKVYDFTILCGIRQKDAQDTAWADGLSNAKWSESKHNTTPSVAWDAAPWHPTRPYIRWEDELAFATLNGVFMAVAHRLKIPIRWGGDFTSLRDLNHWELVL